MVKYGLYTLPLIPSHQGRGKRETPIKGGEREKLPSRYPPLPLWEGVRGRGIYPIEMRKNLKYGVFFMAKTVIFVSLFSVFLLLSYPSIRAEDEAPAAPSHIKNLAEDEAPAAPVIADEDIIAEKNLFHPERKRWDLPEKKPKNEVKNLKPKPNIKNIELFGTVIQGDDSYAVLRAKTTRKEDENKIYMVGDYVSGYYLKEIDRKKVVLHDSSENEDFTIFINEGIKERAAAKTDIKEEVSPPPASMEGRTAVEKKMAEKPKINPRNPQKAKTAEFLKQRLQKHARILKTKKSKLVMKQAQKDFQKIEELLPFMPDAERREVLQLKNEIDSAGE
jgi:hypothetical protein